MRRTWTRYSFGVAALALVLASGSANAWQCDFLTGGGFIIRDNGAKANFGVGGGCKHGSPTWGHLEYIDHGTGLNVHWTSITAYLEVDSSTDANGRPTGARQICGTARTNLFGDVDWVVAARDRGFLEGATERETVEQRGIDAFTPQEIEGCVGKNLRR